MPSTQPTQFTPGKTGEELLPVALQKVFATQTVANERGEARPLSDNVASEEAVKLYRVVNVLRPKLSAEIGFAQGISTTAILQALADNDTGKHHVIDPNQSQQYENCGLSLVRQARLAEWMVFHENFAEEVIPSLSELQFAFIDSSHLFDLTVSEFVLLDKKLSVGGVIGFHDLWMPSLRKVLRYILSNRAYQIYRLPEEETPRRNGLKKIKAGIAAALRRLPRGSRRCFSAELLQPWSTFGLSNMAFIQKTAHDRRAWRFHCEF
jgi:predicted O-methyltransferase YrrM